MKEFSDKVALVTGAGKGLGQAIALAMADLGASVVVADVDDNSGQDTANNINKSGGTATFIHANVTSSQEVENLVKQTVETYGRLDFGVNNAGIVGNGAPVAEQSESDWDTVVSVNLKGVFLCCKYEVQQMLKQGGGAIVNMSSVMGLNGNPGSVAYAASKHGVIGITKSVAMDCATHNIRVNAICPGIIMTPLVEGLIERSQGVFNDYAINTTPMGRLGKPEEIAQAAVWLCSDAASYVTGTPLTVDGGFNAQ